MDAKDIKTHVQNLEKSKDDKTILQILTILKKDIKPTEKLLRETRVGIVVNRFKSSENPEINGLVKKIVKFWKDEVTKEKKSKAKDSISPPANAQAPTSTTASTTTTTNNNKYVAKGPRNTVNDGVKTDIYENSSRNGAIKSIYNGLCADSDNSPASILRIAKEIESEVFSLVRLDTRDKNYKTKLITLTSNIRQKNNPELRYRLLAGDLKPKEFVSMNPKDYAPESLKQQLQEIKEKNLYNAQGAVEQRAVTDRFQCGKCKQKKVSYYQLQTRSADEPLTTFCTCENCGNRWKFS